MNGIPRKILLAVGFLSVSALACSLGATASPTQAPGATAIQATQPGEAPTAAPSAATSAPTQAENAGPTEAAAGSGDPFDLIGRAWRAHLSANSYRRHTVGSDADTKYENTLEYVAPDYIHEIVGKNELIYIKGGGTWRKASDGTWAAAAGDSSAQVFAALDPATTDDFLKTIVDQVQFLGPELLDGRPTLEYQFVAHADLGTDKVLDVTYKMWVGITDGLPYRFETDNDSVLTDGAKAHSETVIEYPTDIPVIRPNP